MQPADGSRIPREGDIILQEQTIEPGGGQIAGIVPLAEIAPLIGVALGVIDFDLRECGGDYLHRLCSFPRATPGIVARQNLEIQKLQKLAAGSIGGAVWGDGL